MVLYLSGLAILSVLVLVVLFTRFVKLAHSGEKNQSYEDMGNHELDLPATINWQHWWRNFCGCEVARCCTCPAGDYK
ncbi:hypothetical protein [Paucilactobacillus hokkaidonensis]|uniref:hypothetical protein n=1 Tax=Paucilactobacillus hokkaidonensis TaxID=1193095 RepID=UPI002093914A|nr:hypothetical protein [Paucilactobacillus hokkaidonensis]